MIKAACLLAALTWALHAPAQTPRSPAAPYFDVPPLVIQPPAPQANHPHRQIPTETTFQIEVRDPDGNPIPGACISIEETRLLVVTDRWGDGTCIVPPGTKRLTLFITATGYRSQKQSVDFSLQAGATIRITLYTPDDRRYSFRVIPCQTPDGAAAASAAGTPCRGAYRSPWW